jgi:energy-coupling factor transport system permease protein
LAEFLLILGILIAARIPFSAISSYLKIIVPVMGIFLILFPLFERGGQIYFQYGWIEISNYGVSAGIIGSSRLGALFFSTTGILFTSTKERDLLKGLMQLGLPFAMSLLLMLSMRFVSLSMADLNIIREARRARAIPERENPVRLIKNLVSIVVPLFIATIRRIQTSSNALEVKGFSSGMKMSIGNEKLRKREILWITLCVAAIVLLGSLRLLLGTFSS